MFYRDILLENKMPNLYFISTSNNFKSLTPRVPDNFLVKHGYEDGEIPRVCFSTSVDGCLKGLSQNLDNKEFYVYQPDGNYDVITPTIKQVPDSKITNERWICTKVKIKLVGKIKVITDDGKPGLKYSYGKNTGELYGWKWKWLEKY